MVYIIIVEKTGSLKEVNVKDTSEEYLSKKAGFKNHKDFEKKTTWDIDGVCDIVLYGKQWVEPDKKTNMIFLHL